MKAPQMSDVTSQDIDQVVAEALQTEWGRRMFRAAFQLAAAKAADHFPEGSRTEALARRLAGLPPRKKR